VGLIRLLLAYAVVLSHSKPIHGYFIVPANAAVTLFFMISGFYMALVMTEKYTGPNRIRRFYSNRILRLYPSYFIAALLMIGVQSYLVALVHLVVVEQPLERFRERRVATTLAVKTQSFAGWHGSCSRDRDSLLRARQPHPCRR
jgi:peptidoglycan/LPS O-acetylase OafA/YrhL